MKIVRAGLLRNSVGCGACDRRDRADQMGHADALRRRQFPHQEHRAVRRRTSTRRPTAQLKITDSLGRLADQASRNQDVGPPGHRRRSARYWSRSPPTRPGLRRRLGAVPRHRLRGRQEALHGTEAAISKSSSPRKASMLLYSVPWPPQGIYAKKEIKIDRRPEGSEVPHLQHRDRPHRRLCRRDPDADRSAGHPDRVLQPAAWKR